MNKILIRGQTLWARHSWSRRQQVMPEPQRSSSQPQFPGDAVGRHKEDARRAIRLAIYLLVLAVGIAGCASQDRRILATTGDLKTGTLALMDKAIEPYSAHAEEIDAQNAQLKRLYDQERTRPGNGPTTRMWATFLQVDPKLPGSGIYPRFLDQWKKKNVLTSAYIEDKKQTVGDAFDKIISLESAKPQR
jgi:hypothetical protein